MATETRYSKVSEKEVLRVREKFTQLTDSLSRAAPDRDVYEIMALRGYNTEEMYDVLKEIGVFKAGSLLDLIDRGCTFSDLSKFGVLSSNSMCYVVEGRYVIPVRDLMGRVVCWIGWYPDVKKYITTPTIGFSKSVNFFGIECLNDERFSKEVVCVVEGIFDAIALRAYGLTALSAMGVTLSRYKVKVLKSYGTVVHIPDNDRQGNKARKSVFAGGWGKYGWEIENELRVFNLPEGVKDVDDYIKINPANIGNIEDLCYR